MATAAMATDAFHAIADPRRRHLLDALVAGERPVNDLVAELDLAQPLVSKHLRVLREVGLVSVRGRGRQRLYRLDGRPLEPVSEWVAAFAHTWSERFDRLDDVLDDLTREQT